MPRGSNSGTASATSTRKTLDKPAPGGDLPDLDDDSLPDLPDDAFAEIDKTLEQEAGKAKGRRGTTKSEPLDDLPDLDVGFDADPSTEHIGSPMLGEAALAGVNSRIDGLVEVISDNHNATMNRLESVVTTLKSVMDNVTIRLDSVEGLIADLKESFHPILKDALAAGNTKADKKPETKPKADKPETIETNWTEVAMKTMGITEDKAGKILKATAGFPATAFASIVGWLFKAGVAEANALRFLKAAGLTEKSHPKLKGGDFPWAPNF